jgi:5-methylcytosine-specific restriction endonuclease McrA
VPKETVTCDNCGAELRRWPSHINDNNFCDRDCHGEWLSEHKTGTDHPNYTQELIECDWCGNELSRPQWRVEGYDRQFCDLECKGAYFSENPSEVHKQNRIEVACTTCGETLERIPARIERSEHHFCSLECKGEWWSDQTGGEDHALWKGGWEWWYGENWEEQRQKARKRDGYRCWFCGVTDGCSQVLHGRELSMHHVVRKDDFDDLEEANRVGNLLTVCDFCHSRIFQ